MNGWRLLGSIAPTTRQALVALALIALTIPTAAPAQEPQTSLADLEDEVMCIVCGVVLEHAIEAPQAIQEREFIQKLVAQGLTKDEIKDRLVDEFGSEVLAIPEASGFDLAAWLVPGVAIVAAGGAIVVGLRRWRRAGRADEAGETEVVDAGESERLDADLARYEL